jgi:hypothetical protein
MLMIAPGAAYGYAVRLNASMLHGTGVADARRLHKGVIMPVNTIPDNYLSSTRMNMFTRCSMQYYFRYCEGLIAPPSGAMSLGSSFHAGIEYNYVQKLYTQQDLNIGEILDAYSTDFDHRKHETAWHEGEKPGMFKDQGVGLLQEYHHFISPMVQPASVEMEFEIPFDNKPWTFMGRVDLVDVADTLIEAKTIGRTPGRPEPDHMRQVESYTAGLRSTGAKESSARIDYAVKNKKPKIVSHSFQVADTQIGFFLSQVSRVAHMIENEMFLPNRGQRLCSHRFCGFASRCEQLCGGIVPER